MKVFSLALFVTVCSAGLVEDPCGPGAPEGHKLEYVAAIWRHGDRAPTTTFKDDLYNASFWDNGYAELTSLGIQQHRQLGRWIHERYVERFKLLREKFNENAIKIRTTYVNRTKESALYNFKGLYGDDITYDDLHLYSPLTGETDIVGFPYIHCNYTAKLGVEGLKTDEVVKYLKDKEELVTFLTNATGAKIPILVYLISLADPIIIQKLKGLILAEEYEKVYDQINALYVQSFRFAYGLDISPQKGIDWRYEFVKMQSGGLFNILLDDITHKDKCANLFRRIFTPSCYDRAANDLRYRAFSMHDVNVLGVLNNLNFPYLDYNRNDDAELGSALFIELWNDPQTRSRYIKIVYRRKPNEVYDLSEELPDCPPIQAGLGCSLEEFVKRSEKYLIKDQKEYCSQTYPEYTEQTTTLSSNNDILVEEMERDIPSYFF